MIITLGTARAVVEKAKEARGRCPACYDSAKRCEPCASVPFFPWATRLDVERVRGWMEKRFPNEITAFALNDLEELT